MIETEAHPVRPVPPSCGCCGGRMKVAGLKDRRCLRCLVVVFRDGDGFLSGFQVKVRFFLKGIKADKSY